MNALPVANNAIKGVKAPGASRPNLGLSAAVADKPMRGPDVIATRFEDIALFEAQTSAAANWLSSRCDARLDNVHDQLCVNSNNQNQIIQELKAAGFWVMSYHQR